MMKKKVGFIGAGNMAGALLAGVQLSELCPTGEIAVFDVSADVCEKYRALGYTIFSSITELVENSEMVVVAVTPQVLPTIVAEIRTGTTGETLFISLVAGISIAWYQEHLGENTKIVRTMPTLTAEVGLGACAVTFAESLTAEERNKVTDFLASCGLVEKIPEDLMCQVVPVNGSAPAYFYHMAQVVVDEAEAMGLDNGVALRLFAQTMKGSAERLLTSGLTPQELENQLRLPGGTTMAALDKMEALGFDHCVQEALRACAERCVELGKL